MQTGYDIVNSPALGISSDGTTHRGITVESRHSNVQAQSYGDENVPATWKTRFLGVERAQAHTGEAQHRGNLALIEDLTKTYTNSPTALRQAYTLNITTVYTKLTFQNGDHAADGRKFQRLSGELKRSLMLEAVGDQLFEDLSDSELVDAAKDVTEEDVERYLALRGILNPMSADYGTATAGVISERLGQDFYNDLNKANKALFDLLIAFGCGMHKDLNALVYGTKEVQKAWLRMKEDLRPVALPNKANDSTITLAAKDSAAAKKARENTTSGAIKLLELFAALARNKNSKKGYHDRFLNYMREALALRYLGHALALDAQLADVSNTRYGCYPDAAIQVVIHHDLYSKLLRDFCDTKTRAGENHMEKNVLLAFECPSTMVEMCAYAVYGVLVGQVYMGRVCGTPSEGATYVNQLDLIDLHRRVPIFCMRIAINPSLLFDPSIPDSELTLDNGPIRNADLLAIVRLLEPELPHLKSMVSALFRGCARGWCQFTQEFLRGGPIDTLPELSRALVVPEATNCKNEGGLGAWRVACKARPNISTANFSAREQFKRNGTEAWIDTFAQDDDHRYVMQLARERDASGENARMRKEIAEAIMRKAEETRARKAALAEDRRLELAQLATVGLVLDEAKVGKMIVKELRDQLRIYKNLIGDPTLEKQRVWGDSRAVLEGIVLAALSRYKSRIPPSEPTAAAEKEMDTAGDDEEERALDRSGRACT
ncbi:hypothetical protein C8F01DRAFT_1259601 [Mycena amicta]|nr:hypothetical protein C8F01DRAFT_1259601 [Mycena amicta]